MAGWNALFVIAGLLLIALAGEAYFRLTKPFLNTNIPRQFVDEVGLIFEPNAEVRYGKSEGEFWVVQRANSQGFLDREPVSAERAAAGCHIAFIGDSFVEAKEAPIADKFHVRLEEMAARELPHLAITTQAYGITGTGQINQLPFYDEYARRLIPKLVVLVFFLNDFMNNSPALDALYNGVDPDRMPYMSAQRDEYGVMKLRPPDPEYARFMFLKKSQRWYAGGWNHLKRISHFARWLEHKNLIEVYASRTSNAEWANMIAQRPCCAWALDHHQPSDRWYKIYFRFVEERLPPVYENELEYTAFGIDQFKRRTDRDGVNLAILAASEYMGRRGDPQFDRLSAIAGALGIPVISDYDYIVRQGYDAGGGLWHFNQHWNATGHQWVAAEAVLEWLKANQDVCD